MWTPIRSHVRTALTVGAQILIVALVVVALLFVVQRVFPTQTHTYQLYDLEVTPSAPWHPGQSLLLAWVPRTAQSGPDALPRSVTCQFRLYGPYATQAAALADRSEGPQGTVAPLADSTPPLTLSTDVAARAPTPMAHALPAALAPGTYVVVGTEDRGNSGVGGITWVVEVTT